MKKLKGLTDEQQAQHDIYLAREAVKTGLEPEVVLIRALRLMNMGPLRIVREPTPSPRTAASWFRVSFVDYPLTWRFGSTALMAGQGLIRNLMSMLSVHVLSTAWMMRARAAYELLGGTDFDEIFARCRSVDASWKYPKKRHHGYATSYRYQLPDYTKPEPEREPTNNQGIWASYPELRLALDRLGAAVKSGNMDMHFANGVWCLRHGGTDEEGDPTFHTALKKALDSFADLVNDPEEVWASDELLAALAHTYEVAGFNLWSTTP